MVAASELSINTGASATGMAEEIFGDGVTVVSASYSGDRNSSGIYSGGDTTSPGVTPGDTGVILSTGRVRDFTNSSGNANQSSNTSTNTRGVNNDADFNAAAGTSTYDASILEVDFIPTGDTLTMQFVFASDEYPEFQSSIYQDFVGVWVNGTQVDLAVGDGDTDPGNLNSANNQNLYVDNTGSDYNTEMDGFTVTMTLTMSVIPGVVNTLRLGIADVSDSSYDSSLLIAGDSVQGTLIAQGDSATIYPSGTATLDVLDNDSYSGGGTLTITHINGIAVVAGSTVTLATGQTVALNADGTISVVGDGDIEDFNFTYTVSDGSVSDTGIVGVSAVPCFTAGTLIDTQEGPRPVEDIAPGDLVLTRDDGVQPVRWVGRRTVAATGKLAPVRIRAGTFGDHGEVLVSPQHRILIGDVLAELMFGEPEVLVAAQDLLNDRSVTRREGGEVIYVHLMFDRHQIVFTEGLASESFLPGPQTAGLFEAPVLAEIQQIFPDVNMCTGSGYSPAARRTLKHYEAQVLLADRRAA